MTDVGFLSTISASVGQTLKFSWAQATVAASLPQQATGQSDVVIINNLSPCTFRATLDATGRSFTLPAGVPTQPIPVSWGGSSDRSISLFVETISSASTANQVHFDWFRVGEPIIYVASSGAAGIGSISLTNVTTDLLTFPPPVDNWTVAQNGIGNLVFTDTTTTGTTTIGRDSSVTTAIFNIAGGPGGNFGTIDYEGGGTFVIHRTGLTGASQAIIFQIWDGAGARNSFGINDSTFSATNIVPGGGIGKLAGQATAGSFGVPVIVAQALNVNVTTTAQQTLLSYTPSVAGIYRVSGYCTQNGTLAGKIVVACNYSDNLGAGRAAYFSTGNYVVASPYELSGQEPALGVPTSNSFYPVTFYSTTAAISCNYQDPTGVPNDNVWFIIERLS